MIRSFDFVAYPAKDHPRAVAFYRDTLGLKLISHTQNRWAEFELEDGNVLALYHYEIFGQPFAPSSSLCLGVDDVAGTGQELAAKGVIFPNGTEANDTGVCHVSQCLDSEGNILWLHKRYA